jgi:hypothetical protein
MKKIFLLTILLLILLLAAFIASTSWGLIQGGNFTLKHILTGAFPEYYTTSEGSDFNAVRVAMEFGIPFVAFLGIIWFFQNRKSRKLP